MGDILKQDHYLLSHIDDLIRQARDRYYIAQTDFLDMHEQTIVSSHLTGQGVSYLLDGGYPMAERRQLYIQGDNGLVLTESVSASYLKITLPKLGIKRQPNHRDYLGALMNLGIERKLVGDILVFDSYAIVICSDSIREFVCENLTSIGSTAVSVSIVSDNEKWRSYVPAFEPIHCTVASNRLDALVKAGTNMSRTLSMQFIKSGKVFVNSLEKTSPSTEVEEGSIISVRGKGKFRLSEIGQMTKKGRISLSIDKYR